MDLHLKGKRTIVLGGTRGIGRAIADTLAAEGANVAVCARNHEQVEEAVAALTKKGVKATGASVDIAKGDELKAWVESVAKTFGGLDVVVSNASALTMGAHAEAWEQLLKVDILGAANAFEAARPHLEKSAAEHGDASAVFISSVSAAETQNAQAYGAIKAALIHYAKGLSREVAKKNIRVNVVSPGTVYFKGGVWHLMEQHATDRYNAALKANPTGRMGTPQEIANAAVFLASPVSSFTTGANWVVDGAITQRVNF
jgi:3-oxoacyl-[acyl-carrier protein] reductase